MSRASKLKKVCTDKLVFLWYSYSVKEDGGRPRRRAPYMAEGSRSYAGSLEVVRGVSFIPRRPPGGEVCRVREFARAFYLSKEWRRVRAFIVERDAGLCVKCGRPGEIVHHKEHLTPENINDPSVALGEDNLELLCRDCHGLEHTTDTAAAPGLMFDEEGNLVERELLS